MHNLVHAEGVLDLYDLHEPYRIMLQQLNALLNGLNWQPAVSPFDEDALRQQIDRIREQLFPALCDSPAPNP